MKQKFNINKLIFGFFCFFVTSFLFSQNNTTIIIPDISTELSSEYFSFDENAIPDFSVEPLKEVKQENLPEEPPEEPILPIIEEVVVVQSENIEIPMESNFEEDKNLFFAVGGTFSYAKNTILVTPHFDMCFIGDGFNLVGNVNLSFGGFDFAQNQKKTFIALEKLGFSANFELPYDLALSTKVGIDFFQGKNLEKSFDFAIPLAITFGYEGFQNWSLYSEFGQRTFRPFENSFYGSIGAFAKYGMIKNKTEIQFGKKIGIVNDFSFSTNFEKYEILLSFDYFIKDTPCYSIGGLYKF